MGYKYLPFVSNALYLHTYLLITDLWVWNVRKVGKRRKFKLIAIYDFPVIFYIYAFLFFLAKNTLCQAINNNKALNEPKGVLENEMISEWRRASNSVTSRGNNEEAKVQCVYIRMVLKYRNWIAATDFLSLDLQLYYKRSYYNTYTIWNRF